MKIDMMDQASDVAPLLVQLYDSHKIYKLARDKNPVARAELTKVIAGLFKAELSFSEGEVIADIMIGLLRQAEKDLRQAIAQRLSPLENVPLRLVLQIANDEVDVAESVLKHSPVLGDVDLVYIIKSKTPEYWQAIAARKTLSEQVANILANTRDLETAIALARNENITLTRHALTVLSDLAQGSESLARPLLRRDEVDDMIAEKLYKFVGNQLRQYIVQNYTISSDILLETLDNVVGEFVASQSNGFMPNEGMLRSAERIRCRGLLDTPMMVEALRRGQIAYFIALFSKFTGLAPETTCDIITQSSGQGLAVACRAFGVAKPDFVSMFVLTNPARGPLRILEVSDIERAIAYYNRIEPDMARKIVGNSV